MKVYELRPKKNLKSAVYAIALVENPAIEVDFVYLSKDKQFHVALKLDEEKRMIYTPVLIPNKRIYREDEATGEPYEIFFSEETVRKSAHDFSASGDLVTAFNSEHNESEKLDGVTVVENWVVDNPESDKATTLGFKVPKGTWMQGIRVENDAVRSDIKSGKIKGVSIEGIYDNYEATLSKQNKQLNNITMTEKVNALQAAINFLKGDAVKLSDEKQALEEVKAMALEDGEYTLDNGQKIIIRDGMAEMVEGVSEEEVVVEEMAKEEKKEELSEEAPAETVAKEESNEVEELAKLATEGFAKLSAKLEIYEKEQKVLLGKLEAIEKNPVSDSVKLSTSTEKGGLYEKLNNRISI